MRRTAVLSLCLLVSTAAHAALPDGIDEQTIRDSAAAAFPDYFELLSMPSDSIVSLRHLMPTQQPE